jgi:hypothetical protein
MKDRNGRFVLALVFLVFATNARSFDILYLKEGASPLKCRVEALGDNFVKATVLLERAGAPATKVTRSYPLEKIDFIDFEIPDAEASALKAPTASLATIRSLWNSKRRWLPVGKSNAGEIGLILSEALLSSGEPAKVKVALETFKLIERSDWNKERQAEAQQGRLQSMLALGQAEAALAEAKIIARESEDPAIMIKARYVMARAKRQEFEALLGDNPKWREDDEVRDEVEMVFNASIDQFLFSSLFFGSFEEQAARGLWNAAEVFDLAEDAEAARNCASDIVALYNGTEFSERARALLENRSLDGK